MRRKLARKSQNPSCLWFLLFHLFVSIVSLWRSALQTRPGLIIKHGSHPLPLHLNKSAPKQKKMSQNNKYNLANEAFHRFVFRAQIENDDKFNRILNIFTQFTEAIEQNKLVEFEQNHGFNAIF